MFLKILSNENRGGSNVISIEGLGTFKGSLTGILCKFAEIFERKGSRLISYPEYLASSYPKYLAAAIPS
jgi:hypothetical protein